MSSANMSCGDTWYHRRALPGSITQCVKSNEEHASCVSSSNKTKLGFLIESRRTLPGIAALASKM